MTNGTRVHVDELLEFGATINDTAVRAEEVLQQASDWPGDDVLTIKASALLQWTKAWTHEAPNHDLNGPDHGGSDGESEARTDGLWDDLREAVKLTLVSSPEQSTVSGAAYMTTRTVEITTACTPPPRTPSACRKCYVRDLKLEWKLEAGTR